jgi:TRAP-type C4-dicarboxylate transport system substrate-binding protein
MLAKMGEKKLDGGGFSSTGLAGLVPEVALLELPFLFEDDAEADAIMDGVVREDMAKAFEAKGLYLFVWGVNGWVDFGSSARPILSVADIQASKPYTRDSKVRRAFWAACGAKPQVLTVPEVAGALKAGTIDLYETTPLFAAASQWFAETKHWTVSHHVYQPAALVFDLGWWRGLPEPLRKSIEAMAPDLQAGARRAVRGVDRSVLDGFKKEGIALHALGGSERDAMKKATAGVAAELVRDGAFPAPIYEKVAKAIAARRAAHASKADPTAEGIAKADQAAAARPALAELGRGETELDAVLRRDPKCFEAAWRMARMQFYLGHYGAKERAIPHFETGIEWAKRALALAPQRVEGHFWLGLLYGAFGEAKGISSSLFLVGDMQKALERARELEPKFDGGGPPRILGRLFYKLPWVAGGSNKKAIQFLRESMKIDPTMPYNYTYLAEVLIDEDGEKEAKDLLKKLMGMTPVPRWAPEFQEVLPEARRLLKKLD